MIEDLTCYVWFAVIWLLFIGGFGPVAPLFEWGCYLALANLALSWLPL